MFVEQGRTEKLGDGDNSYATSLQRYLWVPRGSLFILFAVSLSGLLHQPPNPKIHRAKSAVGFNTSPLPFSHPGSLLYLQISAFIGIYHLRSHHPIYWEAERETSHSKRQSIHITPGYKDGLS